MFDFIKDLVESQTKNYRTFYSVVFDKKKVVLWVLQIVEIYSILGVSEILVDRSSLIY